MMNHMSPVEMEAAAHGQLLLPQDMDENVKQDFLSQNANGIVTDNRKVVEGGVFAAIKGERVDGHDFIQDSFANGALLCISEEDPGDFLESKDLLAGPILRVGSTVQALRDLAAYYRSTLTIPVVGVIGSVGKTSTKEMIASVLGQKFRTLKTEGNQNNGLGLPLTILRIDSETEAAVVEMGISMFGEMHILGRIARPDFVVMTNIGNCHLENLKDRDGVLKAKTEVFEHLHEPATLVLNGDDDKLRSVGKVPGAKIYFYGVENQDTFVHASDVESLGMKGMKASIHVGEESFSVVIPLPGGHNVMNALAATAVGYKLGLSIEEIRAGIESVQTIAGRSHFLDKNGMPEVAMHWEHRFNHAVHRYNDIFRGQMPNITPHICRHTYCSNMAKSGMSPKTLQYLMGHSEIGVTMNVYTHLGLEDATEELRRVEDLNKARAELEKATGQKPMKQTMFKAI